MDWLFNTPIAHRGLHDDRLAENSFSAYRAAIDKGLNIEIDVHITTDGTVFVFHDDTLKRVCGIDKHTNSLTAAELGDCHLCGTEDTIPTFADFLKLVDGKVGILIELKTCKNYRRLCEGVAKDLEGYTGNYAIQSFSPFIVKWFETNHPEMTTGLLSLNYRHYGLIGICGALMTSGKYMGLKLDFISFDITGLKAAKSVQKRHREGKPLLVWTINTPERLQLAKEMGADNIICELPAFSDGVVRYDSAISAATTTETEN